MTTSGQAGQARALSQLVAAPLTPAAIFLVVTVKPGPEAEAAVRGLCADIANLLRAVGFRDLGGRLSCIASFGSEIWDRLFGAPRPAELHPFREFRAGARLAIATPGDILFHIRGQRMDLCFELASQIMNEIGDAVAVADEVHGFSYFDQRDLLGFVDGTANPDGQAALDATLVGAEDPAFAGGSYVIVQKYLHDLGAWNALPNEAQERIIGRTKLTNVELDAATKPSFAHNELTKIVEGGEEIKIVRDNMPFGEVGKGISAPISSAMPARRAPSSRCSKTCLSASRPAIMTAFSISARPSPATCFSCRPPPFSKTWRSTSRLRQRRPTLRNPTRQWPMVRSASAP
jgi:porphyrinogen peroxidase